MVCRSSTRPSGSRRGDAVTLEITSGEYTQFLGEEYLGAFIADGGSAVKVAVAPDRQTNDRLIAGLLKEARSQGYVAVRVDAAVTRVSLIQQIFHAVAREVDWRGVAQGVVRASVQSLWPVQLNGALTLEALSAATGMEPQVVRMEMQKALQNSVFRDYRLAKDLRLAMFSYCAAELEPAAAGDQTRAVLEEWLRGELRLVSAVKDRGIFQKIGRHNARVMVASTATWLRSAGGPGLLVVLDVDRLSIGSRREVTDAGLFYTQAHVIDAYEVVRQFIDSTDEIVGALILVVAPTALVTDDRRGFAAYAALKNRIWDDVRDRVRPNPYAPMVRLASDVSTDE
jgi:hypothetical protein